jgi:hypothetical protein
VLKILASKDKEPNKSFVETPRVKRESNLEWLKRNVKKPREEVAVILLGGIDSVAFRLRVAQSHLRHDLTPSSWSHAVLVPSTRKLESGREISLEPKAGFAHPPTTNALQTCDLHTYADSKLYPNIAVLLLPVPDKTIEAALEEFQKQRAALDTVELLVGWLAFVWGVGRTGNPLLEGNGIPSAAMIEIVVGAAGLELTPNLPSRSSCPEAIWQAARWWSGYYRKVQLKSELRGWWCCEHDLVPE